MDDLKEPERKMVVITRRLKLPGILDTMSDQIPEVLDAVGKIMARLPDELDRLEGDDWRVVSHSITMHSGLIIATFLCERAGGPGEG